jgi:hypothetical protein
MVDEKKELAQTAKLFEYMAQLQKTIKITPAAVKSAKKGKDDTSQLDPHFYNSKALRHLAATTTVKVPIKLTAREVTNAKAAIGTMSLTTLFAAAPAKTKVDNNPTDVPPGKEEP